MIIRISSHNVLSKFKVHMLIFVLIESSSRNFVVKDQLLAKIFISKRIEALVHYHRGGVFHIFPVLYCCRAFGAAKPIAFSNELIELFMSDSRDLRFNFLYDRYF